MSTTNLEHNELITCDLCKRRYNTDVYQRHINENQCIKRNQRRLPFESIKQRSIQIGDKVFSIQPKSQTNNNNSIQIPNSREKNKEYVSHSHNNNKQYQHKIQTNTFSNNRRRTLEQAKQLLERRTKYKPPCLKNTTDLKNDLPSKSNHINRSLVQSKEIPRRLSFRPVSPKKSFEKSEFTTRQPHPITKFKKDDLSIKASNHHNIPIQQPKLTHSPKIPISSLSKYSNYQTNEIDQTFPREPMNSARQSMRKAYTWTRSSKQISTRDVVSPIQIPTYRESSAGPSHDMLAGPVNQNYDDDDGDEFERYSPTPLSTPKFSQDKKFILPLMQHNFALQEQQTFIRPATYQKVKRSEKQKHDTQINRRSTIYSRNLTHHKNLPQSSFHLPPINSSPYTKTRYNRTMNREPWR